MDQIGRLNAAYAAGKTEPLKEIKPNSKIDLPFKTDSVKNNNEFYPDLSLNRKAPDYAGPGSMIDYLDWMTNLLG